MSLPLLGCMIETDMWIQTGNIYSKLVRATPEELEWLRGFLTFAETKFLGGRRPRNIETCLLNAWNTFPSGLVRTVLDKAKVDKQVVQLIEKRVKPYSPDPDANIAWLRDYQKEAVDICCKRTRGIIWIPTGGGKGEIVCALTRAIPGNWLFVVHRSGLMYDIAKRYDARAQGVYPGGVETRIDMDDPAEILKGHHGLTAGRIGDGQWEPAKPGPGALTCATFQTLSAAMGSEKMVELVTQVDGVIFDEAHTLPAESFWKVSMALSNAYYRIGLSGTPLARGDKKSVYTIAATGPVIYRIKPEVLIKQGVLARPKIKMVECVQESEKPTWQGVYGECIVRSVARNKLVVDAAKRADKPCLVFVKELKHGKVLVKRLEKEGLSADFVWGNHSQQSRDRSIESLVRGDTDVLVCSVVFQEGVDVPELESVVIAAGGKSVIATLQRIGRGMRSNKGKKKTFEVFDFLDSGNKFLERHAKGRRKAYLKEGHEVMVVRRL